MSRTRVLAAFALAACALATRPAHAHAHAQHAHRRSLGGLHDADAAVALRAALRAELAAAPAAPRLRRCAADANSTFQHSAAGYWEACGGAAGNLGSFAGLSAAQAEAACCANGACAGFSFACEGGGGGGDCAAGAGYYKANLDCGFVASPTAQGFAKPSRLPVLPNISLTVSPSSPLPADAPVVNVTVSFAFGTAGAAPNRTTDWVGLTCAGYPIEDYLEFAPVALFAGWESGRGSLVFSVFRSRCDLAFNYFRGSQPLWPTGVALVESAPIFWEGPSWASTPFHNHVAYGGEDAQHGMVVSFTTNSTPGDVTVMLGSRSGVYDLPNATDVESTTYGAEDTCNAPANTTSIDFWQWPGTFHHVTVRNLQPATRYFYLPVADGVAGEEGSFVTGKPLGPEVPLTFASYGDMSITQYVLTDQVKHDVPDAGPGAVGTSQRVRARIDAADDIDFVLHYGDLGYATGAIWLWDMWMSMMSHIGSRVPYMVSVGNHEVSSGAGPAPLVALLPSVTAAP